MIFGDVANKLLYFDKVHGYPPIFIFPKIYLTEIHVTKLSTALIFLFPIHHIF